MTLVDKVLLTKAEEELKLAQGHIFQPKQKAKSIFNSKTNPKVSCNSN